MQEFYYLAANGVLGDNFLASLVRVLIGFCAGSIAGIAVGVIMGWMENINKALHPVISLFYPIPALGWLPLLMLWIGINEMLPIAIIFICCFFPVLYNTVTGIRNVDKDYIRVARTLGASDAKVLATVVMPLALPNIFTGLEVGSGNGVAGNNSCRDGGYPHRDWRSADESRKPHPHRHHHCLSDSISRDVPCL